MDIAKLCLPMWAVLGSAHPYSRACRFPRRWVPLVEKVRVPWCYVSFTCREGERSLTPDVKGLGVQRLGTFRCEDMMLTVMPSQVGPTQCG
jgi:hypothetical protein